MAILTWVGDVDANWNTDNAGDTNWDTNTLPMDGDTLIFDGTGFTLTSNNDTAAGNSYTLQFTGGEHVISGNSITLDNPGIDITAAFNTILGMPLNIGADAMIASSASAVLDISGPIDLGANLLTVDSAADGNVSVVIISGGVSGTGDITNSGGFLVFSEANTYTGVTTLNSGVLNISADNALGDVSGNTVFNGGSVRVVSSQTAAEELEFNAGRLENFDGDAFLTGPIVLNTDIDIDTFPLLGVSSNLTLLGQISGSGGFTLVGGNSLVLSSTANNYDGATNIQDGTLELGAAEVIPDTSVVTLAGGTTLDLNSNNETIGSLVGIGTVSDGGILTVAGEVAPGENSGSDPGIITVDALTFGAGGEFVVNLNGTIPGTEHDQAIATDTVDLNNATLTVNLGYVPDVGDTLQIIDGTVTGTFAGLNEGDTVVVSGLPFTISYAAGVTLAYAGGPLTELPITLVDGEGFEWEVSEDGAIEDGSSDAFDDDGLELIGFPELGFAQEEDGGRELVSGTAVDGNIEIARKVFVSEDGGFARFLEIVTNTGSSTEAYTVAINTELGSGEGTRVVTTSSGDQTFDTNDDWIITDDGTGGDPTVVHVTAGGSGSPTSASTTAPIDNEISYAYDLTLAPGETQIVMHFSAQDVDNANAVVSAVRLADLDQGALAGMSTAELAQVVNFDIPAAGNPSIAPLTSFTRQDPRGSLIYAGDTVADFLFTVGETLPYSVDLDAGQTITVVVEDATSLQAEVELLDPNGVTIGTSTATTAGEDVVLQTVTVDTAGTYQINVTGAGGTTGGFEIQTILNAHSEVEILGAPANDTVATAQNIDASFLDLGNDSTRGAVIGQVGSTTGLYGAAGDIETFLAVDVQTGTPTLLATNVGGLEGYADLAQNPVTGVLYASREGDIDDNNPLYTIDIATRKETLLVEVSTDEKLEALAWSPDGTTLYAVADQLFGTIDITDGTFTLIRDLDIDGIDTIGGLAFQPSTGALFAVEQGNTNLYTLNLTDGTPTLVADTGDEFGSLEFLADGTLLGGTADNLLGPLGSLREINPADGTSTLIGVYVNDQATALEFVTGETDPEDYYSFSLEAGDAVSLALTGIDDGAELELLDDQGTVLATGSSGASNVDLAITNVEVTETGTYIARVANAGLFLDYSLVTTRNAAFDIEDNDGLINAQSLPDSVVALGFAPGEVAFEITQTALGDSETIVPDDIELTDGEEFIWDLNADGSISDGGNDAFDTGLDLVGFPDFAAGFVEEAGREVVIGEATEGDITITRKIFVSEENGYARFLEIITNTGTITENYTVTIETDVGSDSGTQFIETSSGDQIFNTEDDWLVSDDSGSDPAITHVVAGGGGSTTTVTAASGEDDVIYTYDLTLAPGETQIVMHFSAQSGSQAEAIAKGESLSVLGLDALAGMTPTEVSQIVNFAVDPTVGDFYTVAALAGDTIDLQTITPADGAFEFDNELDPQLELFDPTGVLVASDDNSAADGRNALLSHIATVTGNYTVRVVGEQSIGEYVLQSSVTNTPALSLSITPTTISENGGTATATVTRQTSTNSDLVVDLVSDDTSEAIVPSQVTILANETAATFQVDAVDDTDSDGSQSATITASATGLTSDSATVIVTDDDAIPATLRIEGEDINNVMGYRLEGKAAASGGQMLSLVGNGGPEVGMATFLFTGATGLYDVDLGTFDESDGTASLTVEQNGTQIGSTIVLDQNTNGSGGANNSTQVTRSVGTGILLTNGATIKVTGFEQASEHARFDFIEFTPANGGADTPPTASNDAVSTDEANTVSGNVLTNDSGTPPLSVLEVEGSAANVNTSITLASGALLTVNSDGSFTYDPNGVFDALDTGENDTDSFTYLVSNTLGVSEGTVTVTVDGLDDSTLGLTIVPNSISENGGMATATVSRNTTVGDLLVTLNSSDTGEATLPSTVTIEAGNTEATFTVTGQDDNVIDGTQNVTITATAAGFNDGSADIDVTDDDAVLPTVLVEAEEINSNDITGYRIENRPIASGGSMLSLVGQSGGEVGMASFTFNETSGNYTLVLGTFDENDGQANFVVEQNGVQVGSTIVLDQDPGGNSANAGTKVERIVATNVFVSNGDTFKIMGNEVQGEHARFDFFRFDPADDTPDVAPVITTTDSVAVNENQTFVLNINATDANGDTEGSGLTYSITGGADDSSFNINANTGVLSFDPAPDFEVPGDSNGDNVYGVEVTVTDSTGLTDAQLLTVTVDDVNETGVGTVIRLEGEDADIITNYRTEDIGVASGNQALSFVGAPPNETGSATFEFNDTPGNYDIIVGTFDEADGMASFTVELNDFESGITTEIATLDLTMSLGSNLANAQTFISPTVATGIGLTPGDTITVNGFENGS